MINKAIKNISLGANKIIKKHFKDLKSNVNITMYNVQETT